MTCSSPIKELFNDLIELPAESRLARLDELCGSDPSRRERLEQLLRAYENAGGLLADATIARDARVETATTDALGQRFGAYKVIERLGEGGFGTVYLAEQELPVRRRVALKIIKPGMDSRQVIARFEAERQALAMMDHPNIARVLDGGATDAQSLLGPGRPYFVMELVRGVPITQFCDEQHLDLRDRLALFTDACHAVQHAHQKGIIHRDLKPSNVLVSRFDEKPVVKIIDFGIAKAVSGRLTDTTLFTEMRQLIGTPAYMSPEQAGLSDLDIDTRSDIYSLGVLLYELLTGVTPFDAERLRHADFDELRRIIREEEPPRPSTRLSSLLTAGIKGSKDRGTKSGEYVSPADDSSSRSLDPSIPRSLVRSLRGDLDWIVMKCLEKDRTRRYETASALSADVRRQLAGEPVLAAPPSAAYRMHKFVRRNRGAVAAAGMVTIALVLGLIGTVWQAARATGERNRALATKSMLDEILAFPQPMLSIVQSGRQPKSFSPNVQLIDVIDDAVGTFQDRFASQPEIEADVRFTIGRSYLGLSRMADATRELRRALELYQAHYGDDDLRTLECLHMLGWSASWVGDNERAESALRTAASGFERLLGRSDERTLSAKLSLAMFVMQMDIVGVEFEAENLAREVLAIRRQTQPESARDVIMAIAALSYARHYFHDAEEARQLGQTALDRLQALPEPSENDEFWCRLVLGNGEFACGRYKNAEQQFRAIVAISERVTGRNSLNWAAAHAKLGESLLAQERWIEAEQALQAGVDAFRQAAGPTHSYPAWFSISLAQALLGQGRRDEALSLVRTSLDVFSSANGPTHDGTLILLDCAAGMLLSSGEPREAESIARKCIERWRSRSKAPTPRLLDALYTLASAVRDNGRPQKALPLFEEILHSPVWDPLRGDRPSKVWRDYAELLLTLSRFEDAERELLANRAKMLDAGKSDAHLLDAFVNLYEIWDAARPSADHAAKAAEWRDKLAQWQATTQPAAHQPDSGHASSPDAAERAPPDPEP